jgi:hypothetical protein
MRRGGSGRKKGTGLVTGRDEIFFLVYSCVGADGRWGYFQKEPSRNESAPSFPENQKKLHALFFGLEGVRRCSKQVGVG